MEEEEEAAVVAEKVAASVTFLTPMATTRVPADELSISSLLTSLF